MRLPFPRVSCAPVMAFVASLLFVAAVQAGAPAKPAEVTTALPPVPLASTQLGAIAAKGVPQAAPAKPAAPKTKLAHPAFLAPPASAYGVSPAAAAKLALASHPLHGLPQISPALGVIPRPEWKDPFSVKQPDIAMIGAHPTPVPGTPAVRR